MALSRLLCLFFELQLKTGITVVIFCFTNLGHTELCPSNLKFAVISENGILEQYGQSCYEWVPSSVSWFQAESSCNKNGGHLVQIADAKEEEFITKFMNIHDSLHAVWIGLHDTDHEEKFTWTSGNGLWLLNLIGRSTFSYHL